MSRLTEYRKDLKRYEYKLDERGYCYISEGQIVNKLGKLEDILEKHNISDENLEQILTKYEAIDNAKPSKALECLVKNRTAIPFKGQYDTIKQALETFDTICTIPYDNSVIHFEHNNDKLVCMYEEQYNKISKKEQAFDVIKEKDVDLRTLKSCFNTPLGLQEYNKHQRKENELTEEEFNLLKSEVK